MESNLKKFYRVFAIAMMCSLASSFCGMVWAADAGDSVHFRDKPVRIIVPFPTGSPPDIMARIIQTPLSRRLGQTVLVETRTGANGNIGVEYATHQPEDGYTYVICGLTCASADVFYKDLRFDMRKDLTPVINFGVFPSVLIVSAKSPFNTATELLDYIRKNPGTTYASWGRGGSPHIAAEQLRSIGNLDVMHIPFSTSDPLLDIAAQRVTFMFTPAAAAVAKKDLLRMLAVASAQREPLLPGLPTMEELGLKGFRMEAWNGLWASSKAPTDRLESMNQHVNAVLQEPETKARFDAAGMRIIGGTRQDMVEYFDQDNQRWHAVAQATGIQAE